MILCGHTRPFERAGNGKIGGLRVPAWCIAFILPRVFGSFGPMWHAT
jgi:hypothetical protein